ncbi:MAG: Flp pilus assembly complex ATPase component TadA [Bdellovibrionales bacterium]|nr:Flp pilus assembly complex ATPase component TadA [Bdellovibrionales bacterium]
MTTPDWLQALLRDPDVTDVCINGSTEAWADRRGEWSPVSIPSADARGPGKDWVRDWAVHQLAAAGRSWDARSPYADALLPGGIRLHAVFPPASPRGVLVSLRRLARSDEAAPPRWSADPAYARVLEAARSRESIVVSGATGSGKTTLVSELLGSLGAGERIVALEDVPELAPRHPHFLSLVSRPANADGFGEITVRDLLRQSLRMRPDRIVLGECRGTEVLELLQALNTGHGGAFATLHADSARDALRRIELLCLLASGGAIGTSLIRELIASGLRWVAHVERAGSARFISELCRIEGREGDTVMLRPVLLRRAWPQPTETPARPAAPSRFR